MLSAPVPSGDARRKRSAWEVQRAVIFALVLREMRQRVGSQWIGAVWTVLEPLAHMIVLVTIIGLVRGSPIPGIEYPVFLVTGLIPYFFFNHLTLRLMACIDANRGIFAYRQVKPIDALAARAVVEALMNLIVYGLTLAILARAGFHVVPVLPLELIGVHLLIGFFGLSAGILAAVVSHDRPRVKSLIRVSFLPLYFMTGVIFRVDLLPREYLDWLLWNPMLHLVELSRHSFIAQYRPAEGVNLAYPAGFALAISALAMAMYRRDRLRLVTST